MIQLSNEDFVKMTEHIKFLEAKVNELKVANEFLNDQIRSYNEKYVYKKDKDKDNE